MKTHVIFDLDGTLIDSKAEILATYLKVFEVIKPENPPDVKRLNYGSTINDLLGTVYKTDPDKIPEAKKMFASIYDNSDYTDTTIYEGVTETLRLLKNSGATLHIATNKRWLPTKRILEIKGISDFFDQIMANEMQPGITPTKKEMIAMIKENAGFEKGFMVGDSMTDIIAGNDEKLVTIAVTYGYENEKVLLTANPRFIIDRFERICTFVGIEN